MNPGTYNILPGDTVHELVILAGGFSEWADVEAVDLSMSIKEGVQQIHIPFTTYYKKPEKPPKPGDIDFPLNINTATAYELQALPNIGPVLAQRIADYRDKYGPFKETAEIMNIEGIGEKKYEDLLGLISIGDELPWE
jgi:competence protein ComEA